jgi:hypothetical protein
MRLVTWLGYGKQCVKEEDGEKNDGPPMMNVKSHAFDPVKDAASREQQNK